MKKATVYLNWRDAKIHDLREPMHIQIICGDCSVRTDEAGNAEVLPIRTLLGRDGRCYTCGGTSFVFAADLCGVLRRTITGHRSAVPSHAFEPRIESAEKELWNCAQDTPLEDKPSSLAQADERDTVSVGRPAYQSHIN